MATSGTPGRRTWSAPISNPGLTYSELMVRIKGPSALQLQAVFGSDWFVESGEFIGEAAFPLPVLAGATPAQVLPNGPSSSTQRALRMVINLIYSATRASGRDDALFHPEPVVAGCARNCGASRRRGAFDRLTITSISSSSAMHSVPTTSRLLRAGVRIHAYTEAFLHTKAVSIDGQMAWIGSCNLDMRSFELNEEVVALFFDQRYRRAAGRDRRGIYAWLAPDHARSMAQTPVCARVDAELNAAR